MFWRFTCKGSCLISRYVFLSFVCQIYNKPKTKQVVISFIIMVCLSMNRDKRTLPGSKRIIAEPRVKIQHQRMHTYTHTHFLWIFSTNNYLIVSFKVAFHFTLVWISLYRCFSSIFLYFFYCNALAETLSEMFSSYSSSWFEQKFFYRLAHWILFKNAHLFIPFSFHHHQFH